MGISYSVEVDEERSAKAMGRELSVSKKDAVELCRHVKGLPLGDAWDTLRAIADGEEPVPLKKHNSGVGHRSNIDGWDAGRFPKKAAESLLDILYNAEANADNQGYDPDEMVVEHIAAHKVGESRGMKPRAMGRASEWNTDLIDVEVVLLQEGYDASEVPEEEQEETEPEEPETEEAEETTEEAEEEAEEEADIPEEITDIDGVGESKAEALRDAGYETVEDLRGATQDEVAETESVGKALAARIKADVGGVEVDEETEEETEGPEESEGDTEEAEKAEDEEPETEADEDEESETEPEGSEDDTEEAEDEDEDEGGDT